MHQAVLIEEVIDLLAVRPDGCYVDCTYGRGGHSRAILAALGPTGRLLALDRDATAVASAADDVHDPRFEIVHAPFSALRDIAAPRGLGAGVDGVLMDLGVSSPQLDDAGRGFSFRHDGPLDMRMDTDSGESAAEWLRHVSEADLRRCLGELGEERFAGRIARRIVEARGQAPITTTAQLREIVFAAYPGRARHAQRIDPANRTFQAIRMRVNRELEELSAGLEAAIGLVRVGGRIAVIAFHSLEDRIVKRRFRDLARPDGLPMAPDAPRWGLLTRKPVRPGDAECAANPRARSARLRVLERLA